jgi:hypothetical protein
VVTDSAEIAALVAEHGGSILGHGNPDVVFAGPATPPTYTAERLAELAQRQEAARKRAAAPEPLTLDAVIAELATIEDRDKRRALARQSVPKLGMSKEIELTWRDALRTNGGLPVAEFDALRKDAAGTSSRRSGPRLVGPADQAITHRLSDDVFQQVPGVGLFKVSGKQPIKLLPGELTVPGVVEVRDLTPELAPGDPSDTVFRVRYAPAGQDSAREVSVSAEDMLNRQPEWPRRTGAAGRTPKRHLDSMPSGRWGRPSSRPTGGRPRTAVPGCCCAPASRPCSCAGERPRSPRPAWTPPRHAYCLAGSTTGPEWPH